MAGWLYCQRIHLGSPVISEVGTTIQHFLEEQDIPGNQWYRYKSPPQKILREKKETMNGIDHNERIFFDLEEVKRADQCL